MNKKEAVIIGILLFVAILLMLSGCATTHVIPSEPFTIQGEMRLPDNQACSISKDGTEILSCSNPHTESR